MVIFYLLGCQITWVHFINVDTVALFNSVQQSLRLQSAGGTNFVYQKVRPSTDASVPYKEMNSSGQDSVAPNVGVQGMLLHD